MVATEFFTAFEADVAFGVNEGGICARFSADLAGFVLDAVYGIFDIAGDFLWCGRVRIGYYEGRGGFGEQGYITFPQGFVIEFVAEEAEDILRGPFDDWDEVVKVVFVRVEAVAATFIVAISVGNHGEVVFAFAQGFELCFVHGFSPFPRQS